MVETAAAVAFSENQALSHFKGVTGTKVVLAVLAGMPPQPSWEGCTIHLSRPGNGDRDLLQIVVTGVTAGEIAQSLLQALERTGINARALPAAPAPGTPLAQVAEGRWQYL